MNGYKKSSIGNRQSLRWYIVQTKPKKEQVAALNLEHESIEVFFPRMEGISIIYGKSRKVIKSLFPNYIFAHFDPLVSLSDLLKATGKKSSNHSKGICLC